MQNHQIQLHKFLLVLHSLFFFLKCIIIGSEGSGQRDGIQRLRKDVQVLMQKANTVLERNNISNAINPCSNNRVDGMKQKQLNRVLEVF